jgi:hypothetical protein
VVAAGGEETGPARPGGPEAHLLVTGAAVGLPPSLAVLLADTLGDSEGAAGDDLTGAASGALPAALGTAESLPEMLEGGGRGRGRGVRTTLVEQGKQGH